MQYLNYSISTFITKNKLYIALILSLLFFNFSFAQFDIPKIPKEQTSVYDYAALLSASEKESLEQKLIRYSDTTSTQIVVAIIKSTKGENIGLLAPRWGQKWGIGQAKEDNGVFILLASEDRKIWISPGYGVEHKLTAGVIGELTRNIIIPQFKRGDYYAGLNKGTDAVFEVLMGEYRGSRKATKTSGSPVGFIFFVIIIIVFIIVYSKRNNNNGGSGGHKSGGFNILDAIILSNMGRGNHSGGSSFGGGSFGGGGFGGGFGGGGFSGGGAGGSW